MKLSDAKKVLKSLKKDIKRLENKRKTLVLKVDTHGKLNKKSRKRYCELKNEFDILKKKVTEIEDLVKPKIITCNNF